MLKLELVNQESVDDLTLYCQNLVRDKLTESQYAEFQRLNKQTGHQRRHRTHEDKNAKWKNKGMMHMYDEERGK